MYEDVVNVLGMQYLLVLLWLYRSLFYQTWDVVDIEIKDVVI